jgi:hypothetical protein
MSSDLLSKRLPIRRECRTTNAVDRVMRAYLKTRDLTDEQISVARRELAKFIEQLVSESSDSPTKQQPE